MSRFIKKDRTSTDSAFTEHATEHLPLGYDDPSSDYFVPEELRAYYRANRDQTLREREPQEIAKTAARMVAFKRAQEAAGPAPEIPEIPEGLDAYSQQFAENSTRREFFRYQTAVRDDAAARQEQLLNNEFGRMFELGLHHFDIEHAQRMRKEELARQTRATQYERANKCPVCGDCDPTRNGRIEHRPLNTHAQWPSTERLMLKSCGQCYVTARKEYETMRESETCARGVRSELVRAAVTDVLDTLNA